MQKLKPCPFCGGEAECVRHDYVYYCFCKTCHAQGLDYGEKEKAIEFWNRRTAPNQTGIDSVFMSAMEGMYNVTFVDAKKGE
jgi:Lar family restriction alleviation protein